MKINQKYSNETVNLVLDTLEKGKQGIVFVNTKRGAEKTAEEVARKIKNINLGEKQLYEELAKKILEAVSRPTKQCKRLSNCVMRGIAFHHAGLTAGQRDVVEEGFRAGRIKIIASTPTLAAGLDLPAFRTIIRDLKRYSNTGWGGMQFIPVLEYLQMAGRAGRPKYDKFGEAICLAANENDKEKIHEKYLLGEPEEIYSKLAVEPVLRTYLLSLISMGNVNNREQIIDFFSKTFWAFQFKDMKKLTAIIDRMLDLLERYEFIRTKGGVVSSDFISADEINDDTSRIRATLLGKRVAELYIDPLTAHHIIKGIRLSSEKVITTFGLLQMVCNTLEMRPLLRIKTKEYDLIQQELVKFETELLVKEPLIYEPEYDNFLNSVKTTMFMEEWIDERDEDFLLEKYDIRPGEIRYKLERAEWLLYAAEELALLQQFSEVITEIKKLRFRLKYGVKEEIIPLLKLKNIGRVRARKLYLNGIRNIGDVKKADVLSLFQLLGRAVAIDVKKQVGDEVKVEIPKRRRKGQMSLSKY